MSVFSCFACSNVPIFRNSKFKMFDKLLHDRYNVVNALHSAEAQKYARANGDFKRRRECVLEDVNDLQFWQELESSCKI